MTPAFALRSARPSDLTDALALLAAAGLPTGGVDDPLGAGYCVAERAGRMLGVAGLEVHGAFGLLRSVVVHPDQRGTGVARALVDDRLARARQLGLHSVYLLTTTAADYFAQRGFIAVARDEVPPPIRAAGEFAQVCPQSAVVMVRMLEPPSRTQQ
jgi:N-acetylglutamate synthase-like GNAT family acetyltransferase